MPKGRATRKMSAILSADVKGYSRLMGADEEGTVKTLNECREIITQCVDGHRGRVVDSPGDNVLAEFVSTVEAVKCAVKIQEDLKVRNVELPEKRRMEFRIGINLGDVIEENARIYGDGVNIAARLEGLAEAGGICISGTAFDHVKGKLKVGYQYLGAHSVKNIAEPVRAYKILMEPEAAGKIIGEKRTNKRWMAIAAAFVILVGSAGWYLYIEQSKKVEPAFVEKMAFQLPDKPSIAVLAFDNMSGDPKKEYLSDGITEEIITALSRIPRLFVIARNSTFTYKGKPVKVQQVAEELGVQYVLEGSVQSTNDRLRVNVQLIDAITGKHLWAERYEQQLKDIFATQDDITKKVITFLQVELTEGEQARLQSKGTDNLQAYLNVLEGYELWLRFTREDNALARQLFQQAISLDPDYPRSYVLLAWSHLTDARFGWSKSAGESMAKGVEFARKRLAMGNPDAISHTAMSFIYLLKRQHDEAISESEKSIALNPNFANGYALLGMNLYYTHRPEEAIPMLEKALRLNPFPPAWYFYQLARSYLMIGRYQEAIEQSKKYRQLNPDNLENQLLFACAFIHAGREEEARSLAAEVLRLYPGFSTVKTVKRYPYKNQSDTEDLIDCLRKAGLPD